MIVTYEVNATVNCPVFTTLIRNGVTFSCVYEEWAYGLAAGLLCIGGLVPIALIICWWAKLKNASGDKRRVLRRQDSDASTFTDVSRPQDHGVYEVIRDENAPDMLFRTSKKGLPNRYGTFSVPDFKVYDSPTFANTGRLYPDLIQVQSPQSVPTSPSTLPHIADLSANHSRYSSEETIPPRLARKKRRQRSVDVIDTIKDSRVVKFAKRNRKRLREPSGSREHETKGLLISGNNVEQPDDSSLASSIENDGNCYNNDRSSPIFQGKSLPTCLISQVNVKPRISSNFSFQPTPPVKHLVEGMDFDLYLQDCVAKLPEDQRNGTFLIRDSQSSYRCKVLVLYDKEFDPKKTLYHYKICFSDDQKVYLNGSEDLFPSLEAMIDFYRKKRTILPCLLSDCLGKNL